MKFYLWTEKGAWLHVALYMSAWIEIFKVNDGEKQQIVALYMSAWIEIIIPSPHP